MENAFTVTEPRIKEAEMPRYLLCSRHKSRLQWRSPDQEMHCFHCVLPEAIHACSGLRFGTFALEAEIASTAAEPRVKRLNRSRHLRPRCESYLLWRSLDKRPHCFNRVLPEVIRA